MPFLDRFTPAFMVRSRDQTSALQLIPAVSRSQAASEAESQICGATGCTNSWRKPWKNRRRPIFEEEWGCSTRCLETMVGLAVLRVTSGEDGPTFASEEPHRHRVPLGLVLLAQGWITHPQLQAALTAQREAGEGRIGDWLTRRNGLPEEQIARGLGVQWNCPVLSLQGFSPRAMALVMPKRFIAEFGLIPVRAAGSSILYVAFQERLEAAAAFGIEQMCGLKVESGLLTTTQLESARTRLLAADSVPVRIRLVKDSDALTASLVKLLEQRQPVAARLVRIHQYFWMRIWMEEDAIPGKGKLQTQIEDAEDHIFLVA